MKWSLGTESRDQKWRRPVYVHWMIYIHRALKWLIRRHGPETFDLIEEVKELEG